MLYELMERTGHLPEQQRQVYIFLLDEAGGGTRPIGLFTAYYRTWSKARQGEASKWNAIHDRWFFAAGKGRSTSDPVWRQSVRNQLSTSEGGHVASLCWDLRTFYESMSHTRLREQALLHDFPVALADVAINAYKMARLLTYEGQASDELFPAHGIVAGDSLSDALVKLYYLQVFDDFVAKNKDVELDVYFDDIQLTLRGTSAKIVKSLTKAASELRNAVEVDMLGPLALDGYCHG